MLSRMSLLFALAAIPLGSAEICNKVCDNANSGSLTSPRTAATGDLHGRKFSLVIDDKLKAGFAAINNGEPGDEVWIDRSWDVGTTWTKELGKSAVPKNANEVKTTVFNLDGSSEKKETGLIRACAATNLHPKGACTQWKKALICDGDNSSHIEQTRTISTRQHHGRIISCIVSDKDNVGFGRISNGKPRDDCWIDRSYDGGKNWDGFLGKGIISANATEASTLVYNIDGGRPGQIGVIRACGSDHDGVACTEWHRVIVPSDPSVWICNPICDNENSDHIEQTRTISTKMHHGRIISCIVSDKYNVGFAKISHGKPGDDCWIDRSWDGGKKWVGFLGKGIIPANATEASTLVYNIDGDKPGQIGVIRACGSDHDGVACTEWHHVKAPSDPSVRFCNPICDNENSSHIEQTRTISTRIHHGKKISCILSDKYNVGFARISNGKSGDECFLDRSWDGGNKWHGLIGLTAIPTNATEVSTPVFNIDEDKPGQVGVIRACGADHDGTVCTEWHRVIAPSDPSIWICNPICDNENSNHIEQTRTISTRQHHGRIISCIVSDKDNVGFATISNGKPGDDCWIDRSWDGGKTWGRHFCDKVIADNSEEASTLVYNIDGSRPGQIGVIRACGSDHDGVVCTHWHRIRAYNKTSAEPLVCNANGICDNENPERLIELERKNVSTAEIIGRQITLIVFSKQKVGFARISNGKPGDDCWIDRSWDGGISWDDGKRLGFSVIPENKKDVSTPLYNIEDRAKIGSIRACGKAGNQDDVACTLWYRSDFICNIFCDNENSKHLKNLRIGSTKAMFGRQISILVSDGDKVGFARILNGKAGDEIWVDRRWSGGPVGSSGNGLGHTILYTDAQVDTSAFNFVGNDNDRDIEAIRACGKVKFHEEIICTTWYGAKNQTHETKEGIICSNVCDNTNSLRLAVHRLVHTVEFHGRKISVIVSDNDNAGYAIITNGQHGDRVRLDRSWNAGRTWDAHLGGSIVPDNAKSIYTAAYSIDGSLQMRQIGVIRACGKPGNINEDICTPWTRASVHAGSPAEAAATALMMEYNDKGQWDATEWWSAANCLTAIIDYMKVTGDRTYMYVIKNTFEENKNEFEGNFCNNYMDDTGWWGLAWIGAYDLTRNQNLLNTAAVIADYMYTFTDNKCGGGLYWSSDARTDKNAISNELFIKLTAALHNRIPGDIVHLNRSLDAIEWFETSGMITDNSIVNDGLTVNENCQSDGRTTRTYNQGVILGGYVELYKATQDLSYLDRARKIADAVVNSSYLSPNGILHEPCRGVDCNDAHSFKGVFARNLGELNAVLDDRPYQAYIARNAETVYEHRNSIDQYGFHYEGPWEDYSAATQHSALDMLTAAHR